MWSDIQALEGQGILLTHGRRKQGLAVREGGAGPGVHAPGPAAAPSAGGLWLPPARLCPGSGHAQAGEFQDHAGTQKAALTKRRWDRGGCAMCACSFGRLLQFLNKQLDLDAQLEVYDHLDRCDICRDTVYQLARDRDGVLSVNCTHRLKPFVVQHSADAAAGSPGSAR